MDALTKFRLGRNLSIESVNEALKNLKGKTIPRRTLYHLQNGTLPLRVLHVEQLDKVFKLTSKEKRSLMDMVEKSEKVSDDELNFLYSPQEVQKLLSMMKTSFPKGLSARNILDVLKTIKKSS